MIELPEKYVLAKEMAVEFLKRMAALESRYENDEVFRRYFTITGGKENAALKRTSMDLTQALVTLRRTK